MWSTMTGDRHDDMQCMNYVVFEESVCGGVYIRGKLHTYTHTHTHTHTHLAQHGIQWFGLFSSVRWKRSSIT